mmetsp:Transcript_47276/g.100519  ORF Transcript_47276/g.100519 Transcript_47276/m.100519 type:complete len:349 (-) Transcript_47276:208-1254(-)
MMKSFQQGVPSGPSPYHSWRSRSLRSMRLEYIILFALVIQYLIIFMIMDTLQKIADTNETQKAMITFERWRQVDVKNRTLKNTVCDDDDRDDDDRDDDREGFSYMHFSKEKENYLLRAMADGVPFSWIRLGDGEFNCILKSGGSTPEQRCTKEIHDMYTTFMNEIGALPVNFFMNPGWWWLCKNRKYRNVRRKLMEGTNGVYFLDSFYFATDGNETGGHYFASFIRDGPVFFVGAKHFKDLTPNLFPHFYFIETPAHSDAGDLHDVEERFRLVEKRYRGGIKNMKVLVSMGLTSKIFIFHMAKEFPQHTFIDTGSSMDHFVGKKSRDYNKNTTKMCLRFRHWMKDGLC